MVNALKNSERSIWKQRFASYKFIALVVAVAGFTDGFIYGMILPVTPDILRKRIGIPEDQVQIWTSTLLAIFGLAFLITPPFVGFYADRSVSKRTPFLIGLILVALSTIFFFVATCLPLLLIGRALQAVSCSFVYTCGLGLVARATPDNIKGTVLGYVSLGTALGDTMGPGIGGFLYTQVGHYAMFAVAMGIVGFDFVLRMLTVEEEKEIVGKGSGEHEPLISGEREESGDVERADFVQGSMPTEGLAPIASAAKSRATVPAIAEDVSEERASLMTVLSKADVWAAIIGFTMTATVRTSLGATLTLYLARQFHWSSSLAGLVFFSLFLPNFGAPLYGRLADAHGPRLISTLSTLLLVPSLTALGFATSPTPITKALFVVLLFIVGVSLTMTLQAQNLAIVRIAGEMERRQGGKSSSGMMFSLGQCGWSFGMLAGPMMAGGLMEGVGWGGLCWCFAGLSLGSAVFMGVFSWRAVGVKEEE